MICTLFHCNNFKMAGRGRQSIDYVKPKEPSFLAKFKREIGYKEGPTVDSKKANLPLDDEDDRPDADDEQPLVVVLKDGDLTKEEYEAHKKATGSHGNQSGEAVSSGDDAASTLLPGKLMFKKPAKRKEEESTRMQFSSSKKKKDKEKSKQGTKGKKVKNASLLSFYDEEDEET
ncbi:hypothetical protein HOLleu_12485 [Holothuria leucospilota]|uniref:DUF4604 domain-containing protein n=1 Tax=Holothuria leucospilota TaxID=206669 RepID=A0A9Q1CBF1_HOLLE|nr:hypothetical protein HOLleu_12485 [Holothuria leucospilota]